MGQRVAKADIKSPHFYFKQVGTKNQYNKDLMVAYFPIRTESQFAQWESQYKQANQCNKQSILLPQSYDKYPIKKYMACCECPADFEMSIVYERFDSMYKTQLAARQSGKIKRYYNQQELFHILYELASGIKEFQIKGLKFGDIRPSKMAITESTNSVRKIKMINNYTSPMEISPIDKIMEKYDKTTLFYLSPEEIIYINSPARNEKVPNPKTEAFSLGVTMIQAAILQNSEDFYGKNPRSIDIKLVHKRLQALNTKYPLLKKYVELLLKQKPEQRYSCGELYSTLKPYAENISSLKKFTRKQNEQGNNLSSFRKSNK